MKLPDPPGAERAKRGLTYADEDSASFAVRIFYATYSASNPAGPLRLVFFSTATRCGVRTGCGEPVCGRYVRLWTFDL